MGFSEVTAAHAFQQIATKFLCSLDQHATAEILQASAEHARGEISGEELSQRQRGPFDRICLAYDRADQPLN